jgi:prepilin-type N-terminal cleavage/methylation domain-containing protein
MKNKGFTLIELLLTMVIIGILAMVAVNLLTTHMEDNKPKILHMEKDGNTTLKKLDLK